MSYPKHRAVWAEDGAPLKVCWSCQSLWPCARVQEVSEHLGTLFPVQTKRQSEALALAWLNVWSGDDDR